MLTIGCPNEFAATSFLAVLNWYAKVSLISLGIVSAIIALVLFLASRTQWGQNKPLTKCIVLAVLAHIWLLMYAYGTRVQPPGFGNGSNYGPEITSIEFIEFPTELSQQEVVIPETLESSASDVAFTRDFMSNQGSVPIDDPSLNPPDVLSKTTETQVIASSPTPAEETPTNASDSTSSFPDSAVEIASDSSATHNSTNPVEQRPSNQRHGDSAIDPSSLTVAVNDQVASKHEPQSIEKVVPDLYQLRISPSRSKIVAMMGGDANTEAAVEAALQWLAKNQEADGSWNAARHGAGRETKSRDRSPQTGSKADTGMTALALLAFLGAGYTTSHQTYGPTVEKGLVFLVRSQMSSGDLAGQKQIGSEDDVRYARMYCHGMALLALAEAYAMTGDPRWMRPIQSGVAYTLKAQNPTSGGWRYQSQYTGDPGDLSQFGWQAMALSSARHAGFSMTQEARTKLQRFLDSVARGSSLGLAVYRPFSNERPTPAMTAEALATRLLLNLPLSHAGEQEAKQYLLLNLPGRTEENVYYWYYATMALFQGQDQAWQIWNQALKTHLIATQNPTGNQAGSWDPRCIWAGYGGRVYSTAMSCLCLEVYYRYLPIYRSSNTTQWASTKRD